MIETQQDTRNAKAALIGAGEAMAEAGRFLRDARELDLTGYDLVVSDYEPVVSRAGRKQGRRVIGIGHQYAFGPDTPTAGASWCSMR